MMTELHLLLISAISLGFVHTLLGPDHYLPFIVLGKARKWSQSKTLWITFFSGIGHVAGSVILGIIGIAMGISVNKLEQIEANRGSIVGWMLIVFGMGYTVYGIYKFIKHGGHNHLPNFILPRRLKNIKHLPTNDKHVHDKGKLTPWILFLIFVFGPCEVLIPLLIYPAAQHDAMGIASVSLLFGLSTILTMLTTVYLGYKGFSFLNIKKHERYMHLVAGTIILFAGVGMQFLGW
jgi:nickel/cobalt exporter